MSRARNVANPTQITIPVTVSANLTSNAAVTVGNTTVNSFISSSTLRVGNTSVNAFINSTAVFVPTEVDVGANVTLTTTGFSVGNSTVNTSITSTALTTVSNTVTIGTAAYFVANGNVGIGTSSPTDTSLFTRALDLNGTSGAAYYARTNGSATNYTLFGNYGSDGYINNRGAGSLAFYNNNAERMRIDSNGRVGIGTTSPGATLSIRNGYVRVQAANQSVGDFSQRVGLEWTQETDIQVAKIEISRPVWGNAPSDMLFFTRNLSDGNVTEKMRITNAGRVGVGTGSGTDSIFHIQGSGTTSPSNTSNLSAGSIFLYDTNGSNTNSTAGIFYHCAGTLGLPAGIGFSRESASDWGTQIRFYTHPSATSNLYDVTERARIYSGGDFSFNGTNLTTQNGNVGKIYKFFGGSNNLIMIHEIDISDRYGIWEFRRAGRSSPRAAQISLGTGSTNIGEVYVYSSAASADVSGGVQLTNGATSWSTISDIRLKTVTGTYANALQDIAQIEPIKFTWKHDTSNTPQVGISAQSIENTVPEAIARIKNVATPDDETEYLSVRYTELIPLMIAAIKELKAITDTQSARIEALEAKVNALENN